jgi:flagellar basal body rod protein FlgG
MLQGLYSAASSMDSADLQHAIISRNLAHANVPGFRRMLVHQQTSGSSGSGQSGDASDQGQGEAKIAVDFKPGAIQQTGRGLDLALMGDGFFSVNGPNGPLYTRNGSFHINPEGTLVTTEGLPVRDDGGSPIQIPNTASEMEVAISEGGQVMVKGRSVGVIGRYAFPDPNVLVSQGTTLFEAPPDVTPSSIDTQVGTGMQEGSNVVPATELVLMISGMRQYEAAQRMMQSIGTALRERIQLEGK